MKMKEKLIFRNIFLTAERMSTVDVLVAHRTPGMVAIHLQEWMGISWSHVPSVGTKNCERTVCISSSKRLAQPNTKVSSPKNSMRYQSFAYNECLSRRTRLKIWKILISNSRHSCNFTFITYRFQSPLQIRVPSYHYVVGGGISSSHSNDENERKTNF